MIEIIIDKTKATTQEVAALESLPEYQALIGKIKATGRQLGVSLGVTDQNTSLFGSTERMTLSEEVVMHTRERQEVLLRIHLALSISDHFGIVTFFENEGFISYSKARWNKGWRLTEKGRRLLEEWLPELKEIVLKT